jgi:ABC-type transport system involved in multi-copper enzyme maturation permease subunit
MTAQSVAVAPTAIRRRRGGMFLGFVTVLRKEVTEWFKGPKALIVAGVSVVGAVFMTVIPFVAKATNQAAESGLEQSQMYLTMDPTANVLLGWTGQTVALIAVVATMALVSTERDRGTLAWSLTNPVSATSVIAAKFVAAMLVFSVTAVILPLALQIGLATVVYGSVPDLAVIGSFAGLFLALPAFYIALTIGLGTAIKSTAGVAGIAFAVMFVPQILGGLLPIVNEVSPTSIGTWAMAVAKGQPASMLTLAGWGVAMVVLVVGSKLVFDRQEF